MTIAPGDFTSSWTKYTIDFDDANLDVGSGNANFQLAATDAGSILLHIKRKHSIEFVASGLTALQMSIGNGLSFSGVFDIATTVTPNNGKTIAWSASKILSHDSSDTIDVNFSAIGADLDTLTAGSLDIWVETIVLL